MKKLTENRYNKILALAEDQKNTIPEAHNRKRLEKYNNTIIKEVSSQAKKIDILPTTKKTFIYTEAENLGSRKWQHWIQTVETIQAKLINETNCFYVFLNDYNRKIKISKNKILAYF